MNSSSSTTRAGDPTVITPPSQRMMPQTQARADDGYIYPADGLSNEARYPAPPSSRRGYDTQAYQQQPQQQYYGNPSYAGAARLLHAAAADLSAAWAVQLNQPELMRPD